MKEGEGLGGKETKKEQDTRAASFMIANATKLPTCLSVNNLQHYYQHVLFPQHIMYSFMHSPYDNSPTSSPMCTS